MKIEKDKEIKLKLVEISTIIDNKMTINFDSLFRHWTIKKTEYDDEEKRMIMSGKKNSDRIIAVSILKDGKVRFQEKCDTYFFEDYTKEEALNLISELQFFIENS